jgi:hypothetical protein
MTKEKVYCKDCEHHYRTPPLKEGYTPLFDRCRVNTRLSQPRPHYSPGVQKMQDCAYINKSNDCTDFEKKEPKISLLNRLFRTLSK